MGDPKHCRIDERGLMMVVYLRLLFFMIPPLNWILSLSNISFRDYFLGSLLGGVIRIILIAWISATCINLYKVGESMNPLKTHKLLFPLIAWGLILFAVTVMDIYRRKKNRATGVLS